MTTFISKLKIMMHTYNPYGSPLTLPTINIVQLTTAEIQPGKDIIGQGRYDEVKGQIKVTL